jgi:hypothetical protein
MARRLSVCVLVAFLPALAFASPLVVHEWGTFTSIAGPDGHAVEWRPFDAPPDLPAFVHTLAVPRPGVQRMPLEKRDLRGTVRMETPVVYLYAERALEASVHVEFPSGRITEWYPAARTPGAAIEWSVRILPGSAVALPVDAKPSRYYRAREVDAPLLETGGERERFLFYRGVGSFQPPVAATISGASVNVDAGADLGETILFERKGDRSGYRIIDATKGSSTVQRPELAGDEAEALLGKLQAMLVRRGLHEKEARAMIETWRDTWFEDGLRLIYVLPDAFVDEVLPMTIAPRPRERVRVLVGRMELGRPLGSLSLRR